MRRSGIVHRGFHDSSLCKLPLSFPATQLVVLSYVLNWNQSPGKQRSERDFGHQTPPPKEPYQRRESSTLVCKSIFRKVSHI